VRVEQSVDLPVHRFSSALWDQIVATGVLADVKVELLDGFVVDMSPQGAPYANTILTLNTLLQGSEHGVRVQLPLACAEGWRPEPDLAIAANDDPMSHPASAFVAVEVSDSSLAEALRKLAGYARAAIPQVWIVEVPRRVVRVLTEPAGDEYRAERVLTGDDVLDAGVEGVAPFTVAALFDRALGPAS